MPQEKKRRVTRKAPRTQIEDLPAPMEELSEEEASLASGGLVYVTPQNVSLLSPGIRTVSTATSTVVLGTLVPDSDTTVG